MKGKFYLYEKSDEGVVTITLNRPDIHNAFNDEFIAELTTCFKNLDSDKSVRLVVLTGAGKSFCAGADLNWMKSMKGYTDKENFEDSKRLAGLFISINECSKPVIAIVNGAALGGGTGLIASCDHVVAAKSAKIGFTEVKLGLVPAVISPFVMAKIGETNARAYFMSGEIFSAEDAMNMGLVHKVTPLDNLETMKEKTIRNFLQAGPEAACEAKKLIKGVLSQSPQDVTDFTCQTISRIRVGDEGQEGMTALLEKRNPGWVK